jgi:thymidine kinase
MANFLPYFLAKSTFDLVIKVEVPILALDQNFKKALFRHFKALLRLSI